MDHHLVRIDKNIQLLSWRKKRVLSLQEIYPTLQENLEKIQVIQPWKKKKKNTIRNVLIFYLFILTTIKGRSIFQRLSHHKSTHGNGDGKKRHHHHHHHLKNE